jgi:hypothetical protein
MDRALDPQPNRLHEAGYGALITLASTVPFEVTQHPLAVVHLAPHLITFVRRIAAGTQLHRDARPRVRART